MPSCNLGVYLKESDEIRERVAVELRQTPEDSQHFRRRLNEVDERLVESIWNDRFRQLAVPESGKSR